MIKFGLITFLLSFIAYANTEIISSVGNSFSIQTEKNSKVIISNKEILKVKDLGDSLLLHAKKSGKLHIWVGKKKYIIKILYNTNYEAYKKLNQIIPKSLGLHLKINNFCPSIDGKLLAWKDLKNIYEILKEIKWKKNPYCNYLVKWNAKIDPLLIPNFEQFVSRDFPQFYQLQNHFKYQPYFHLQMSSEKYNKLNPFLKESIQTLGITQIESNKSINNNENYILKLILLEVNKSIITVNGIRWPTEIAFRDGAKVSNILESKINWLLETGNGKQLAIPSFKIIENQKIEYFAGGEIPIKNISTESSSTVWKKFGINIVVELLSSYPDKVIIKLNSEFSGISQSMYEGVPAINKNALSSTYEINVGEEQIITGLVKSSELDSKTAINFLESLPIIGKLFQSKKFQNQLTDIILILKIDRIDNV